MELEVAERLEFGVLSLLEVRQAGEPVWLGGERQPVLLALLVVHANELAPVERLVDELFGGQRSDAAVNAVRVAVSPLRRLLENGAREGGAPGRVGELIGEIEALIAADLLRERLRRS
jgi:SARP family transcriptional regulator, regulator of embCAB operon